MVEPLEMDYEVRGFDCGYGGPLTPFALANFFQEAAGTHAAMLGIGMEQFWQKGLTWMLARVDVEIARLPQQGDRVRVRTWPAGTRRLFAQRCLELEDAAGNRLAGALYEYIIVDMEARRPVRPERHLTPDLKADRPWPYADLSPGIEELPYAELERNRDSERYPSNGSGFRLAFEIEARRRHIDHNGHVNNAHFVNWLCDAVTGLEKEEDAGRPNNRPATPSRAIRRFKIDFVHEIRAGEKVQAWYRSCGEGTWLSALLTGQGLAARAMISR
ncbi:MAG: thioesterase [Rectinema sp.]|nr:thioesterase [Rectinema sp.]